MEAANPAKKKMEIHPLRWAERHKKKCIQRTKKRARSIAALSDSQRNRGDTGSVSSINNPNPSHRCESREKCRKTAVPTHRSTPLANAGHADAPRSGHSFPGIADERPSAGRMTRWFPAFLPTTIRAARPRHRARRTSQNPAANSGPQPSGRAGLRVDRGQRPGKVIRVATAPEALASARTRPGMAPKEQAVCRPEIRGATDSCVAESGFPDREKARAVAQRMARKGRLPGMWSASRCR